MSQTIIKLLNHQDDFIHSEKRHTGLVAGYGAGKSHAGIYKTIKKKCEYIGIDVAYYLPTYPLVRDIAFPKFSEALNLMGIDHTLNRTDKEFITPYGRIIMRTMDNPDMIVGYEVGYSLIDEADVLPKDKMQDVFIKVLSRNRKPLPSGQVNQTDFVSTPEGYKFLYDFFVVNKSEDKHLIKGSTYDNPFLPTDYIKSLEESYSPEQINAYLRGEFVNLTSGNVYNEFNRNSAHSDRTIQAGDVLHVGMDFNITKMNAVIHVIDGKIKTAVAEIVNAYDTYEVANILSRDYPNHKIVIYPDASGNSRSTSGKSDHQILREHKFQVISPPKNPAVRDRVNAVNKALRTAIYKVNTHNCPSYTEALEKQSYKNGEPDKTTGFDHITEAGGYFITGTERKISYSAS